MTTNARRLVYFENWIDPIAEEILSDAPGIELVRLSQDDDEDKVFDVMKTAHGYQMLAKTEMLRKWWPDRAFIEKCPNLLAVASLGAAVTEAETSITMDSFCCPSSADKVPRHHTRYMHQHSQAPCEHASAHHAQPC